MKLLLYDMGTYTQRDLMYTLDDMGIPYRNIVYKLNNVHQDAYFEKCVYELLDGERFDAIFSVNYFPVVAKICRRVGIPYVSWSYDCPLNIENIEETLGFETNRVFFFDREECKKFWREGFSNVYHLPLAVSTERLDKIQISSADEQKYGDEIAMVGQLYDTMLTPLLEPLEDYDKGYLTAALETQLRVYGGYFLEDLITEEVVERMNAAYAKLGQTSLKLNREGLAVTAAKQITHMERTILLDVLSERHSVSLYGPGSSPELSQVKWKGSASYFDSMPKIFKTSKINLNCTLKCITSGIPLRVLDILGCGGFLLTNFQPEIAEYFVDGEEVVMYTSLQDAVMKCEYYLTHDKERRQIAKKGYQKVKEAFSYRARMEQLLRSIQ